MNRCRGSLGCPAPRGLRSPGSRCRAAAGCFSPRGRQQRENCCRMAVGCSAGRWPPAGGWAAAPDTRCSDKDCRGTGKPFRPDRGTVGRARAGARRAGARRPGTADPHRALSGTARWTAPTAVRLLAAVALRLLAAVALRPPGAAWTPACAAAGPGPAALVPRAPVPALVGPAPGGSGRGAGRHGCDRRPVAREGAGPPRDVPRAGRGQRACDGRRTGAARW